MLIELLLAASSLAMPMTACDPPKDASSECFGMLAKQVASLKSGGREAVALALTQPAAKSSQESAWPAAGPKEAAYLKLTVRNQRVEAAAAARDALSMATQALMAGSPWDGKQLNASSACSGGGKPICLADKPMPFSDLKAQAALAEAGMGLSSVEDKTRFEAELIFPAWTMVASIGVNWKQADGWRASNYALMLMDVVDEQVSSMADKVKVHYALPRAYAATWNGKGFVPQPIGPAPTNTAFPATHAAVATATALVLARTMGRSERDMLVLAEAVAKRRALAGLHTPFETEAGRRLGRVAAEALLEAALTQDGPLRGLLRQAAEPYAVK